MAKTITQRQKKSQTMTVALGVIGVAIFVVLLLGLRGGEIEQPDTGLEEAATLQRALRAVQQITIPREFFTEDVLGGFTPYEPLQLPSNTGRTDPFAELGTSVPELPEEEEEETETETEGPQLEEF